MLENPETKTKRLKIKLLQLKRNALKNRIKKIETELKELNKT